MLQMWGQANVYARFILLLALVYPVSMMILAYKIEKMFPDKKKTQIGGNRVRA